MNAIAKTFAVCLLLAANQARAVPVQFHFHLFVDTVEIINPTYCSPSGLPMFGCDVVAGDVFSGSLVADDVILGSDGVKTGIAVSDFYLPLGKLVYSQDPALNTALFGFRDTSGFAVSPGLVVENGKLIDLVGGVYGGADVPFIDFSLLANILPNRFEAFDGGERIAGSLVFTSIPEPNALALLLAGCVALASCARRKASWRNV